MYSSRIFSIVICFSLLLSIEIINAKGFPNKEPISFSLGDLKGRVQVKYRPESFYGNAIHRLNRLNDADQNFYSRHTLDINFGLQYGKEYYKHVAAEFFSSFRVKAIWGNPGSVLTTEESIKILDTVTGRHSHFVKLEVPRYREIWFSFNINDAFCINSEKQHYFTVGTFPFELGRGIALGDAYAINQVFLGFYSDNVVEQYAPGYKFTGELIKDKLTYDIYGAILENLSDSFKNNTAKVRGQEFGRKANPQRGFGKIDYVIAGRLRWIPYDEKERSVSFEPYILYNNAPEQKVEFIADASTNLGTFGLAAEFRRGKLEWGFDTAFNFGGQNVRGWDRNLVQLQNRVDAGNKPRIVQINNRVNAEEVVTFGGPVISTSKAVFVPGSPAQNAIFTSAEDEGQNGKLIGTTTFTLDDKNVQLRNDINRFRNPYTNTFNGWMVVGDAAYSFWGGDLKAAIMAGAASGDEDPNRDLDDPNASEFDQKYSGFIGLQEIYSGDRVKSIFLLGGAGRAPRPLSTPSQDTALDKLPSTVSNFTNLVLVGGSLTWEPGTWERGFKVMTNVLSYWTQTQIRAFDVLTNQTSATRLSDRHLGVEANILMDYEMFPGVRLYTVDSVFIPGAFYKDQKGKPLTKEELEILDINDPIGVDFDRLPLLSNNVAYTLNLGIEVKF